MNITLKESLKNEFVVNFNKLYISLTGFNKITRGKKVILTGIFGDCKRTQILEILLENKGEELSVPEIEEMSDISKVTIYKYMEKLIEEEIVEETRKVGKAQFYRLDFTNPVTKLLLALENLIVKQRLEREILKEELKLSESWTTKTTAIKPTIERTYSILQERFKESTIVRGKDTKKNVVFA